MQRRRVYAVVVVLFALLSAASVFAQGAKPPQVIIETVYPLHIARGQTTVINVAVPSRDTVKAAQVSPATGVTVSALKGSSSETEQAIGWWEVTLDVAKDAAPGDRSLVLVLMQAGPTAPATFSISTGIPSISNLRILPPPSNQAAAELEFTAADPDGDLGQSPYIWFSADCGGEPIVGAVRGKVSAGVVRAVLPHLRAAVGRDAAPADKCDLEVRVTDSMGVDSNRLKSTIQLKN
jgi:hypothetical protein